MPETIPHLRLMQSDQTGSCDAGAPPAGRGVADADPMRESAVAVEKPRGRGAPEKNLNALKHGVNCRRDFVVPAAPGKNDYVDRTISAMRRQLEVAVNDTKGRIDLAAASTLNAACRAEWAALIAVRWLRDAYDTLDPDQRLAHLARIVQLTAEREKHISKLGLDRSFAGTTLDILLPPLPSPQPPDRDKVQDQDEVDQAEADGAE